MASVLFTGFPGFLGSELLPRILAREPALRAICVVQPKFAELARRRAAELERATPALAGRVALAEGDVTAPGLGLAPGVAQDVELVFHLAAVYDLSVARPLALRVNVEGTRNVLDLAARCPRLRRLHYVSTCYVSGRFEGRFTERDLERGQRFRNAYEETKYLAEIAVQERMARGLPATIYRPAVVVGDRATGATQKYDGPYYVLRWLVRQPVVAVMPVVADPRRSRLNVVPRDYVVAAIAALSARDDGEGKVFQLADPAPPTVDEMLDLLARAAGRRLVRVPVPLRLAKLAIERVPGVERLMGIPSAAVDYFDHPTEYDTSQAQAALVGSGIHVPRFAEYAPAMAAFVRANPDVASAAMA
jgi:thioester reductase-like protein